MQSQPPSRPAISLALSPAADGIAAFRREEHEVTIWPETAVASTPDLEAHLLRLVLSDWWPAFERGAWLRLAGHLGSTPEALAQRCTEAGVATLHALFERVTLDRADTLAKEVVSRPVKQREDIFLKRFERFGLVDTWVDLAKLHPPPAVLVQLGSATADSLRGLPMLVRLVEAVPNWAVRLVAESDGFQRNLHAEPDSHVKAVLRAGLLTSPKRASSARPDGSPIEEAAEAIRALDLPPSEQEGWGNAAPGLASAKREELPADAAVARSKAELALFWMLEQEAETRGLFRLNVVMPFKFGPRGAELDLYSESLAMCIEVDGPHHFLGAPAYRRDRRKDALLQRNNIWVIRVLAEDVIVRLAEVLANILENVRARRRQP